MAARMVKQHGGKIMTVLYVGDNACRLIKVNNNGDIGASNSKGRLAAFAATRSTNPDSWAKPINIIVGGIYLGLGDNFSGGIGEKFTTEKMQVLLRKSLSDRTAGEMLANEEYTHWYDMEVKTIDDLVAKFLGKNVSVPARIVIQQMCATAICQSGETDFTSVAPENSPPEF